MSAPQPPAAVRQHGTCATSRRRTSSGSAEVEVCATDDGGTARGGADATCTTVALEILSVNDPPSLSPRQLAVRVSEGAQLQQIGRWAQEVVAGPPNERTGQVVAAGTVSTNNAHNADAFSHWAVPPAELASAFFRERPTGDVETGKLRFHVAEDVFGTIQLDVVAKDDGGTARGGVDTTSYAVMMTVAPVNDRPRLHPFSSAPSRCLKNPDTSR